MIRSLLGLALLLSSDRHRGTRYLLVCYLAYAFRPPLLSTHIYKQLLQMVSTRKKKKNKKSFLVPIPTLPLPSMRTQLVHKTLLWAERRTIVRVQVRGEEVSPGAWRNTGGDQGRLSMMSRFRPRSQPRTRTIVWLSRYLHCRWFT